jgi:trafficking protein particle complex subunit 1
VDKALPRRSRMTIYSLYVFDRCVFSPELKARFSKSEFSCLRHCACVYYQDWHRTKRPKPAVEGGIMPAVSRAVSHATSDVITGNPSPFSSPRNTLSTSSGIVIAVNEMPNQQVLPPSQLIQPQSSTGLPFDEEAKLVYGVVLSLRNIIRKISGRYGSYHRLI